MRTRSTARGARRRIAPLRGVARGVERVLGESIQLDDTSVKRIAAAQLARTAAGDPGKEAHLAHLFIDRNQRSLGQFKIEARVDFDGRDVCIVFESGSSIGAFGLVSPLSGKSDVSIIVQPRFGWAGLGTSLGISGFKVIPEVLPSGLLPKTERQIPPWVLSATIIPRLRAMIHKISRRFEIIEEVRSAPCGTVDWTTYASEMVPALKLLDVPCYHPDLVTDRDLRAAIHFTLRKQLSSLETQRSAGGVVFELMRM